MCIDLSVCLFLFVWGGGGGGGGGVVGGVYRLIRLFVSVCLGCLWSGQSACLRWLGVCV